MSQTGAGGQCKAIKGSSIVRLLNSIIFRAQHDDFSFAYVKQQKIGCHPEFWLDAIMIQMISSVICITMKCNTP